MSDPGIPSYQEALEQLTWYGMDPPDGTVGVVAGGGIEFPSLPQERIGQALREVSFDLGATTTDSAEQFRQDASSANPSVAPSRDTVSRDNLPRNPAGVNETHGPRANDVRVNNRDKKGPRQQRRTRKMAEYFEEITTEQGLVRKGKYRCRQCDFLVTQSKARERIFHIILCPNISMTTRTGFYLSCGDKDRPPLLEEPIRGLTAANARKLVRVQHENMLSRLNCLRLAFDPSRKPRFARYLLETERVKKSTPIDQCSKEEARVATDLVMEFVVEENMPFSICDKQENFARPFRKLLSYLRPGYNLPLGYLVGGKLLEEYYNTLKRDVQSKLRSLMRECRGTLMFDGSEDINGTPMINILLRVMGTSRISTSTFFLTTIYTGYDTVDANYYVNMAERVLEEFGGFSNIAGVVTDNTGSVKNARETLEFKHGRLVASQDQAHVSDRLMSDFGEISWIGDSLNKLSAISSALRRYRKMRARLIELMKEYNNALKRPETADNSGSGPTRGSTGDENTREAGEDEPRSDSEAELYREDAELSSLRLPQNICQTAEFSWGEECEDVDEEEERFEDIQETCNGSQQINSSSQITAVTMKKLSTVRFASGEKLLEEYIRLRPVLLRLVADSLFDNIYSVRNEAERRKRATSFVDVIRSDEFLIRVKQVHGIFRACRTYLRVFDSETSIASEVFEATRILKDTLHGLPFESFPEPRTENRQELLEIFENRRSGPFPGRKKIKISLLSDLHVATALLDPYRTPCNALPHMEAFNRHLRRYMTGLDLSTISIEETEKDIFFDEIINQYFCVRARWMEKGMMREQSESTLRGSSDQRSEGSRRARSPLVWWSTGSIAKPCDPFERKAAAELVEFAIRTLSVSPTATATERTFSLESRIHTSQRASLAPEKVRKILFCQWNSRILRRSVQRDEIDIKWELERQMEGMRKLRSVRSAIMAATQQDDSETITVRPTSTDQNTNHLGKDREYQREIAGTLVNTGSAEGNTVDTQPHPQPDGFIPGASSTALQRGTRQQCPQGTFEASKPTEDQTEGLAVQNIIQRQKQSVSGISPNQ